MIPIPSRRLLAWIGGGVGAALLLLIFPGGGLAVLAYFLVLIGGALLDLALTPRPSALEVLRFAPGRYSLMSSHTVRLQVRNRSRVGLRLRLRDTLPESFRPSTDELTGTVPPDSETTWEYEVRAGSRGQFSWGTIYGRYLSVMGLWERPFRVPAIRTAQVYPSLDSVNHYHLLARTNRLDALGVRPVRLHGGNAAFESLREYVRGDDVRLIDWMATARRGRLIVENQRPEKNQTVLLLVDCGRLMNAEVGGASKLDHAINTALLLSHVALARGDRVGLCTFSSQVHGWLAPQGGAAQHRLATDMLYDLRGDFTESDHGRCLGLLAARHRKRALVVVLTDFVDAQTAGDMIAHVTEAGRRHVVLFVALKDPFLERSARGRVEGTREGFRKAAAVELLHDRQAVLQQLRQAGVHVIDAEPDAIAPPVINQYLEIAFRGLL